MAFTSEQAHYSYRKAVALVGLGTDNLISVACNADGAMSPACGCRGPLISPADLRKVTPCNPMTVQSDTCSMVVHCERG